MNTSSLAALQRSMQGYLLNEHNDTDDLSVETANFSKQQRLGIYHDAYRLRLMETLCNDYPALQLIIEEAEFSQLMLEYIAMHPSHHPSLRWFGAKLPQFLGEHPKWKDQLAIIELAVFEWAQIMAFDAANTEPATLADLQALPPTEWLTLQLTFQPALHIIHCTSNAPTLWNALIKDAKHIDIELKERPQAWLIWRDNLNVVYRPLDAIEAWCIQAFLRNENFASVCEGLCDWLPADEVPLKTVQYLQQWLHARLIKSVSTTP